MAGHNKWSQIKHKKAKTDAQRGKGFTKVIKEINVAVRLHGEDIATNAALRMAIQTLLPEPVAPAIKTCGILAKSISMASPVIL
eukprot:SAG25_NODE_6020_length_596_cov_0.579477_2_plen_84_part_00